MKIINSKQAVTLDGVTVFCAEMSDGSTWFNIEGGQEVYSTDDDIENGGFQLADVYKVAKFETFDLIRNQSQFVGHVNSYIDY